MRRARVARTVLSQDTAGYSVFASGNMRVTHSNGGPNDFNVPSPFGVWSHTAVTYDSAALPDPKVDPPSPPSSA